MDIWGRVPLKSPIIICADRKEHLKWPTFNKIWTVKDWKSSGLMSLVFASTVITDIKCIPDIKCSAGRMKLFMRIVFKVWYKQKVGLWCSGDVSRTLNWILLSKLKGIKLSRLYSYFAWTDINFFLSPFWKSNYGQPIFTRLSFLYTYPELLLTSLTSIPKSSVIVYCQQIPQIWIHLKIHGTI